jgi:Riboflavin synthase beta-chain
MQLSIEGLSIGYGILTCESKEQAIVRASPEGLNKGKAATLACLRMIELKKEID